MDLNNQNYGNIMFSDGVVFAAMAVCFTTAWYVYKTKEVGLPHKMEQELHDEETEEHKPEEN